MTYSRTLSRSAMVGLALIGGVVMALGPGPTPRADAQTVTIYINGTQQHYDQPPIERSGRVFVPLRGVFEALGASVVYANGVINATGRDGTTVQLTIGSRTAVVNGNQVSVDVAPFLIGARTLVPLRFISQSLGAAVDYNSSNNTVTVTSRGGSTQSSVQLINLSPANGAVVGSVKPTIRGDFSQSVDPNSVHITLDGRDVSSTTEIASGYFVFIPPYGLSAVQHTVRVTGRSTSGVGFDQSWSFTSGTTIVNNYIHNVTPANGSKVGGTFTVSGTTLPNSRIHVVAASAASFGGIFVIPAGSYSADLTADASGNFSQQVSFNVASGGTVTLRITSTAPTTNAASQVTLHYNT